MADDMKAKAAVKPKEKVQAPQVSAQDLPGRISLLEKKVKALEKMIR